MPSSRGSSRQLGPGDHASRRLESGRTRHGLDRGRAVARDHLDGDARAAQERDRLGRVVAHALGQRDQPDRLERGHERLAVAGLAERGAGPREEQHAPLLARARVDERRDRAGVRDVAGSTSGAPSTCVSPERSVRPLHFQRDENGTSTSTGARRRRARPRSRPPSGCGRPGWSRTRRARRAPRPRTGRRAGRSRRARACRRSASPSCRRRRRRRRRATRPQRAAARAPRAAPCGRADRERDRREQHEALGHERDATGGRGRDGLADRRLVQSAAPTSRPAAIGTITSDEHAQQPVDVALQRRESLRVSRAVSVSGARVGVSPTRSAR